MRKLRLFNELLVAFFEDVLKLTAIAMIAFAIGLGLGLGFLLSAVIV